MIRLRPSDARGRYRNGWLDSQHSFSFGEYYDPQHLGFSVLRVINDDLIAPGAGFPTHPHRDMEIVTYVLDGAIAHKDSMGNGSTIRPGEIQRMSAGTGITHSEYNPWTDEGTRLLQIWVLPSTRGLTPSYEQAAIPFEDGRLIRIAGCEGGVVAIQQDAAIYAARFSGAGRARHDIADKRTAWVQMARGSMTVNGVVLAEGDGASVTKETALELVADAACEVLVFDLPPLNN